MTDLYDFAGCGEFAQPLRDAAEKWGVDNVPYWLAQLSVESAHFTHVTENLNYHAQGLLNVLNGRNGVDTLQRAQIIIDRGQEAIAEALYGGSWGAVHLGNTQGGDGFKFRGRGLIQLTGRSNYNAASHGCFGDDRLLDNPDLLTAAEFAAEVAGWFWYSKQLNGVMDVVTITHRVNGGENALAERQAMTVKLLAYNP